MKKTFSIVLAIWMVISMIACGNNGSDSVDKEESLVGQEGSVTDSNANKEDEPKVPEDNKENPPKELKNYTLLWIPSAFLDEPGEGAAAQPESLIDNVTIQYEPEEEICTSLMAYGEEIENADIPFEKTVTIDGKTYKLNLDSSVANEWAESEASLALKYAYFDKYTCSDPKSTMTFNSVTGRLSVFVQYNVSKNPEENIGEEAIANKADALLVELYGNEYLERYTREIDYVKRSPSDYQYIVGYRRNFGEYLGNDWVRFHFSPKGELTAINANYLDLLAEYDFTQEQLDAAKEAMYSAIYSDPGQWPDSDIQLTIDGLTGTCYMETYVVKYNGKDVEWRLLLALN